MESVFTSHDCSLEAGLNVSEELDADYDLDDIDVVPTHSHDGVVYSDDAVQGSLFSSDTTSSRNDSLFSGIPTASNSVIDHQPCRGNQAGLPYMLRDAQEMNDLYQDFAARLPGPELLKTLQGHMEGIVKFVRHHNGDISAHQWSNATMSWCHIGQYSFARRRTEGPMASFQLSGNAHEVMAGQESTLAYFVALAHQCQTSICEGYMTNSRDECLGNAAQVQEISYNNPSITLKKENGSQQRVLSTFGPKFAEPVGSDLKYSMSTRISDNATFSGSQPYNPVDIRDLEDPFVAMTRQQIQYEGQKLQDFAPLFDRTYSITERSRAENKNGNKQNFINPEETTVSPLTHISSISVKPTSFEYPKKFMYSPLHPNEDASPLVRRLTDRCGVPGNDTIRTVLYDPLARSAFSESKQVLSSFRQKNMLAGRCINEVAQANTREVDLSVSLSCDSQTFMNSSDDSLSKCEMPDLRQSTPEPGWRDRQVEILTFFTPNMSNEQLKETHLNTPQKWKGPFFDGANSPCGSINLAKANHGPESVHENLHACSSKYSPSYKEELECWWSSGKSSSLQSEIMSHLYSRSRPAVGKPAGARQIANNSVLSTNYLLEYALIGIFDKLSSHIQRPVDQHKGLFGPFGAPPEWCLDRSERGALTFFGEDWGQPPQRLGRDPRYRPIYSHTLAQTLAPPIATGLRKHQVFDRTDWRRRQDLRSTDILGW